jgi:hypothetical protein
MAENDEEVVQKDKSRCSPDYDRTLMGAGCRFRQSHRNCQKSGYSSGTTNIGLEERHAVAYR